ncbi:MAG: peptidase M50 [Oscillibacter sp.]
MSHRPERCLNISGGFWLLTAWFGVVNGWELLGTILAAAALHELGHYLILRAWGAKVTALRLSVFGAVMETDSENLSYGRELAAVLAGPAANFFCALVLAATGKMDYALPTGVHLALGAFNLLPVRPLDGGRALGLMLAWLLGPAAGERAAGIVSGGGAVALALCLAAVMRGSGGSLWLLPALCGLLAIAAGEWGLHLPNFAIHSSFGKSFQ